MEEAIRFEASGLALFGILHLPENAPPPTACLLMVVGGPQTRVGSHRSYAFIARELCRRGIPVLRFDYAGIGDSEGRYVGFSESGPSIAAAVEWLYGRFPTLRKVIPWSLCDGATACILNVPALGQRVQGMILCNPYAHSQQGQAKAFIKHYYLRRLTDRAFWGKLLSFRLNPFAAVWSLFLLVSRALSSATGGSVRARLPGPTAAGLPTGGAPSVDPPRLPEKIVEGLRAFRGRLVLLLSTDDLMAGEFLDLYRSSASGKFPEAEIHRVEGADHTFSTSAWKLKVCELTEEAWRKLA